MSILLLTCQLCNSYYEYSGLGVNLSDHLGSQIFFTSKLDDSNSKRLLVEIFLTRSLTKSLAFCEFVSVNFKPCISLQQCRWSDMHKRFIIRYHHHCHLKLLLFVPPTWLPHIFLTNKVTDSTHKLAASGLSGFFISIL